MSVVVNPAPRSMSKRPVSRRVLDRLERFVSTDLEEIVLRRTLGAEKVPHPRGLTVVEADRVLVQRFCDEHLKEGPERAQMSSYLDNGYRGLFAVLDGETIGYVWWFDDRLDPANVHPHLSRFGLALQPGEVWSFDLYIVPEHRGRGTANHFFTLFRRYLRAAGYTRVYGHVNARNLPAVWLHKLEGYEPIKTVSSRVLFRAVMISGGRLYVRNPTFAVRQRFDFRLLGSWASGG